MKKHKTLAQEYREFLQVQQLKRHAFKQLRATKIGRNEPCPCNSGLKFKKCCLTHLN